MLILRTKKCIEKIKQGINQEIKESRQDLESLSELSKSFDAFASNFNYSLKSQEPMLKYKVSSIFLKECSDYLVSSSNEVMHLVTGIELEQRFYLMDRLEKIKFQASPVGAKADINELMKKLVEMDEDYGHLLLGVFHSHPFQGISGTIPSGIDRNLQESLEKSGYHCVQAVFSRDGHIRFFSNKLNFEIEIYGKGVEKVGGKNNEAIFQLTNFQRQKI